MTEMDKSHHEWKGEIGFNPRSGMALAEAHLGGTRLRRHIRAITISRVPTAIHVGTSGWAYPAWRSSFYPADLAQSKFLPFYATHLNSVEVNYTFCGRHTLQPATAGRWLAQTPEWFVFAFRGPKPITHFYRHRLRNTEAAVSDFLDTLAPFRRAGRLGPVLFQLPVTFAVDFSALSDFLREWPRSLRVSFEFRNPSWFNERVYNILRHYGAALCLAERDEAQTPEVFTADFAYLRLRKSRYPAAALRGIVARIGRYSRRGDVFAFFRQDEPEAPFHAQQVLEMLSGSISSQTGHRRRKVA